MSLPAMASLPLAAILQDAPVELNGADTAWLLVSTALVLLMTPALGFFYGGLVRGKNILNTLMMSFASLGVVGVLWALVGYSLAFAPGSAFVGGLDHIFLRGLGLEGGTYPPLLFMAFQGTFAIITAALISGAVVERMRFTAYLLFISLWTLVVYSPIAHWVWHADGWLFQLGALDFAGGTVVHINAGIAAVVAALMVGTRKDYGRQAMVPHNVTYVLLGAGLLWFGWFGFNGGSALAANGIAALAFTNTFLAPMATLVVWMLIDLARTKRVTAVGAATGIVVGLVAITPAAGFVGPMSALALGAIAAVPSYFAIVFRSRTRLDDSLDVFAAHGTGGLVGALLTGVFAASAWNAAGSGGMDGNWGVVGTQAIGAAAAIAYSGIMTAILLKVVSFVTPLRPNRSEEGLGIDLSSHGEEGYSRGEGAVLVLPEVSSAPKGLPVRDGTPVAVTSGR